MLQLVRESLWAKMCLKGVSVLEGERETHIQSTLVEEIGRTGGLNYGFCPALEYERRPLEVCHLRMADLWTLE